MNDQEKSNLGRALQDARFHLTSAVGWLGEGELETVKTRLGFVQRYLEEINTLLAPTLSGMDWCIGCHKVLVADHPYLCEACQEEAQRLEDYAGKPEERLQERSEPDPLS